MKFLCLWFYALVFIQAQLRPFLYDLVLNIPDQHLHEKQGIFDVNLDITKLQCTHIVIGDFKSNVVGFSLDVGVENVGLLCTGRWAFKFNSFPWTSDSGPLTASIDDSKSSVELSINLFPDPKTSIIEKCNGTAKSTISIGKLDMGSGFIGVIVDIFKGLIIPAIEKPLNAVIVSLYDNFISTNLSSIISYIADNIRPFVPYPLPIYISYPDVGFIDWHHDPVLQLIDYIMNIVNEQLNNLINLLTNQTGSFTIPIIHVPVINLLNLSTLAVDIENFTLSGLSTWQEFSLLTPSKLDNVTLELFTATKSLNFSAFVHLNISTEQTLIVAPFNLLETAYFELDTSSNVLNASVRAAVYKFIKHVPLMNLVKSGCLVSSLQDLNFTNLYLQSNLLKLELISVGGDLEKDLDIMLDNVLLLITKSTAQTFPALFHWLVTEPSRLLLNKFLVSFLVPQKAGVCDSPDDTDSIDYSLDIAIFVSVGVFAVVILMNAPLEVLSTDDNVDKRNRSDSMSNESSCISVALYPVKSEDLSLLKNPVVSWFARVLIPICIVANIGLFVSSNTSVGAAVNASLTLGGEVSTLPSLFQFSLTNSVHDMWQAGVYPLSILIAVLSGAWPYLKLIMMLFCWCAPARILHISNRENCLMMLDALGKWSLIDAYILVLMMVSFKFHLAEPNSNNSADVFVEPGWGFHSFLLATIVSLVLTHLILHFHRQSIRDSKASELNDKAEILFIKNPSSLHETNSPFSENTEFRNSKPIEVSKSLCSHVFTVHNRFTLQARQYVFTLFGKTFIVVYLIAAALLVLIGVSIESFEFVFEGAVSLVLNYLNDPVMTPYSVVSLGLALPEASSDPSSISIRWIQAAFFLFVLVIPISHVIIMIFLFLTPMKVKAQEALYATVEVLNAWSAMEVFVIGLIASTLEINQFAQFIIGNKCDLVNEILAKYFDKELHGVDKCFSVLATLKEGCWTLFGACIFLIVARNVVMFTCHVALSENSKELLENSDGTVSVVRRNSFILPEDNSDRCNCDHLFYWLIDVGVWLRLVKEYRYVESN